MKAMEIGIYGRRRLKYLEGKWEEGEEAEYFLLKEVGKLDEYLKDLDEDAQARFETLMSELAAKDPPPDKTSDQMGWVSHMNALRLSAEEIINAELIYA
jgi:hypothetical protein